MAPEQAQAAEGVDHRADLYGVGTILFEMLAGRPPHVAPTHEAVLVAICTKNAPDVRTLRPETPAALARVLERALARERDERIGSAKEFLEELGGAPRSRRRRPSAHGGTRGERAPRRKHHRATPARFATHGRGGGARRAARLHADGRARREKQERRLSLRRVARDGRTASSVRVVPPAPPATPATIEVAPVTNAPTPAASATAEPVASSAPAVAERRVRPSPGPSSKVQQTADDAVRALASEERSR